MIVVKSFPEWYLQEPKSNERYALLRFRDKEVECKVGSDTEKDELLEEAKAITPAPGEIVTIRDSFFTSKSAVVFFKTGKSKVSTPLPRPYAEV